MAVTSPPGSHFNYSEDAVVARVAVDIPAGSADAFSRLTAESDRLSGSLQAVARAQGDYLGYLHQLPQIQMAVNGAQREYEMSLARTAEYAERIARAGGQVPTAGPLGGGMGGMGGMGGGGLLAPTFANPFMGNTSGLGMGLGGASATSMMNSIQMNNPNHYLNMAAQRGYITDQQQAAAAASAPTTPILLGPNGNPLPPSGSGAAPATPGAAPATPAPSGGGGNGGGSAAANPMAAIGFQGAHMLNDILNEVQMGGNGSMGRGAMNVINRLAMMHQSGLFSAARNSMGTGSGSGSGAGTGNPGTGNSGAGAPPAPEDDPFGPHNNPNYPGNGQPGGGGGGAPVGTLGRLMGRLGGGGGGAGAGAGAGAGGAGGGGAGGAGGAGMAGGLRALGTAGLVIGAGVAANSIIQKGGETIQGYKNVGNMYDQGLGGGVDHEMSIRYMAMSPFLSTEQSRQVIMGALNSGYSGGKSFDTITKFMADNLKDMGLSVAQSLSLIKQNVQKGGMSVQNLDDAMQSSLEISGQAGAMRSSGDLAAGFEQVSGAFIAAGGAGADMGQTANLVNSLGVSNPVLKDAMGPMVTQTTQTPTGLASIRSAMGKVDAKYYGLQPAALIPTLMNSGEFTPEQQTQILMEPAQRAFDMVMAGRGFNEDTWYDDVAIFNQYFNSFAGFKLEPNVAEELVKELMRKGGSTGNFISEQDDKNAASKGETVDERSGAINKAKDMPILGGLGSWRQLTGSLGTTMNAIGSTGVSIGGAAKWLAGAVTGNDEAKRNAWEGSAQSWNDTKGRWDNTMFGNHSNDRLQQWVLDLGGQDKIFVKDKEGNIGTLDQRRKGQVDSIISGEYTISDRKDGEFKTFQDATVNGLGGRAGGVVSGNNTTTSHQNVGVTLEMEPELKRWIRGSVTTPNQDNANMGAGSATPNNPGPQGTAPVGGR